MSEKYRTTVQFIASLKIILYRKLGASTQRISFVDLLSKALSPVYVYRISVVQYNIIYESYRSNRQA